MRRREFITLLGSAAASWPVAAAAQSVRIGLFASDNPVMGPASDAFLDELRKEGFIDGQNLVVERKSTAQGSEALVAQALEMARANLDVLVALGSETTLQACARATRSIPIVFVANNYDPIARGYVSSLARPGGNATGVFLRQTELAEKQVELLTEALPGRTRLAVVWDSISADQFDAAAKRARLLRLEVHSQKWRIHPTTSLRLFAALALAEPICFWFCPANFWPGIAINSPSMQSTGNSPGCSSSSLTWKPGAYCHTAWTTWRCTVMAQLLWPDSQGRQGVRPTSRTADQIRDGGQSEDRKDNWRRVPNLDPPAHRRGDRMRWRERDFEANLPRPPSLKPLRLCESPGLERAGSTTRPRRRGERVSEPISPNGTSRHVATAQQFGCIAIWLHLE